MIRPVTAMISFFPTDETHKSPRRLIKGKRSQIHYRLSRATCLPRLPGLLSFCVGQGDFDDLVQAGAPEFRGDSTEDMAQAVFPLQPGRTGQDPLAVERDCLDHLNGRGTG